MCFPLGVRGWTLLAPPSPDSLVGRTYDLKKASESLASKIYASSPSPSKRNPVMRYLHSVFQPNRENTVSLNAAEGMSLGFGLPPVSYTHLPCYLKYRRKAPIISASSPSLKPCENEDTLTTRNMPGPRNTIASSQAPILLSQIKKIFLSIFAGLVKFRGYNLCCRQKEVCPKM